MRDFDLWREQQEEEKRRAEFEEMEAQRLAEEARAAEEREAELAKWR